MASSSATTLNAGNSLVAVTFTETEVDALRTSIADDELMSHYSRASVLRGLLERAGYQAACPDAHACRHSIDG